VFRLEEKSRVELGGRESGEGKRKGRGESASETGVALDEEFEALRGG
jgi:hypothetical protein